MQFKCVFILFHFHHKIKINDMINTANKIKTMSIFKTVYLYKNVMMLCMRFTVRPRSKVRV